ncbi:MAG: OmpA family protein [Sphingobacteriales bacterium]|nr:OmpA family protein [Sphingobacteriales bacterium]
MMLCFTAVSTQVNAQEFGIELNGGLQGMQYSLKNGQTKLLPAGSLGLNYTFRLSSQLGLLTGVTAGLYRTQITLPDGQLFTYNAVDDMGSAFEYRLKFTGYKETQHFLAAGIPLLLQYHTGGDGMQWYIEGGAKLLIPFNASTQISARQVDLTGYYPDFNVELSDLPQHGFGTLDNWKTTGTLKLRPAAALHAGTGIIFKLSPGMSLYTGLFIDYGLNNLKDNSDTSRFVTYNSNGTNGPQASSVLNTKNTDRSTLLSYGLQIRLGLGHGRARSITRPDTAAPLEKVTAQPLSPPAPTTLSSEDAAIIDEPIIFGIVGEISIPELQRSHLDDLANLLKRNPGIRLSIVGHYCDGERTTEKKTVGEARAKAVAKYLQKKGIPRNRMTANPAAESDPAQLSDPAANYQSRRVIITAQQ